RRGERPIRSGNDFRARAAVVMVGDRFAVEYYRDGVRREGRIEVGDTEYERVPGERIARGFTGARLQNARAADDPETAIGVALVAVAQSSATWQVGLRVGDLIVAANGRPVRNMTELAQAVKRSPRALAVRVRRGDLFYDLRLPR
ncbi:MAG: PDZ domain-containing protein, partial [Pseudomonadales bacterium]|nr:PDZ domain-containing protein [Pseudomonadales bacterium]